MTEIKHYIQQFVALLPVGTSVSYTEAERRASEFLVASATLVDWKHVLSGEKIKLLSVQTVVYAEQMGKGTAKTVTENKLTAEASSEYTKAREELEAIDNDISYLKAYLELFNNAHLFYRQLSKESK
jgi:hypothetical protein